MKILLVRLSSMGDVIHNLPAVSDIALHYPNAELHWVVEEGFAELPALHPAVRKVIPVALRRWRKSPFSAQTRAEWRAFRANLAAERYDLILDSQGLVKSALVTKLAKGPCAGYDRHSIREPLASFAYDRCFTVSRSLAAIPRNRILSGLALGYTPGDAIDYGLPRPSLTLSWCPPSPYVVMLTATSRADKEWPEAEWITLGRTLQARGLNLVFPWGSPAEQARSQRLAAELPGAIVPPRLTLPECAAMLAGARLTVGVDTGLVHLAAAMACPVVAIYCASDPGLTGVMASTPAINLGSNGQAPGQAEVWQSCEAWLA